MADKISPEERLLKVIQEEKKSPSDNDNSNKKETRITLRPLKQFFANLKPKSMPKERLPGKSASIALPIRFQEIDLKAINKLLAVILVILTILVIHYAVNKGPNIAGITDAISKISYQAVKKGSVENFKPVAFYIEQIRRRDIFKPSPRAETKVVAPAPRAKEMRAKLKELVKDLKLVGISWGKSPKAMIRSEKKKKTYFLRQGQMIGTTGIKVKTISKDKVVINYQGEEMGL